MGMGSILSPADRYRAAERAMWTHHGADAATEQWTDVPDLGIRVRSLRAGSGRPILFIHGGPNAGATWGFRPGMGVNPEDLRRIGTPALWLSGDSDPFGSPELIRDWAGRMPSAQVTIFPDSGHLPWLDDPAGHAEAITTFWARVSPPDS